MNNQEHNSKALKKGIQELSQHKAPDFVWSNIEKDISKGVELNRTALDDAIHELPEYKLEKDLWEKIDNNLLTSRTRIFFSKKTVLKIAASLILFLGISFLIKNQMKHRGVIEISTAIVDDNIFNLESLPENCSTNQKEIDQICSTLPEACQDPFVIELKAQLEEVNSQYNELKALIENSPTQELIKYLQRVENEKCQIESELLALIINS